MNISGIIDVLGKIRHNPLQDLQRNSQKNSQLKETISDNAIGRRSSQTVNHSQNGTRFSQLVDLIAAVSEKRNNTMGSAAVENITNSKAVGQSSQSSPQKLPDAQKLTDILFERKDLNQDGLLSLQEQGDKGAMFSFVDTNKDAHISREETLQALYNRQQSLDALTAYAKNSGTTLRDLMISKLDISEEEADKILNIVQQKPLRVRA